MDLKLYGDNISTNETTVLHIFSVFILAIFCGMLMYLAVDNFKKHQHEMSGIIGIFLCVSVFILCGFEHSIADMSYCVFALETIQDCFAFPSFLILVTLGNSIGAFIIRQFVKERE